MIIYNDQFFDKFQVVMCFNRMDDVKDYFISIGVPLSRQKFYRWRKKGDISLYASLSMCNHAHFPVAYLFVRDDGDHHTYRLIPEEQWKEVHFLAEKFFKYIMMHTSYAQRETMLGMRNHLPQLNKGDYSYLYTLPVKVIIEFCAQMKVYPGEFFVDENVPIPFDRSVCSAVSMSIYDTKKNDDARYLEGERQSRERIQSLEDQTDSLQKDKDHLNATLAQRDLQIKNLQNQMASMSHEKANAMAQDSKRKAQQDSLRQKDYNKKYYEKNKKLSPSEKVDAESVFSNIK